MLSTMTLAFPGHYLQKQDDAPRQGRFRWGHKAEAHPFSGDTQRKEKLDSGL
jgi:hypothetical protein